MPEDEAVGESEGPQGGPAVTGGKRSKRRYVIWAVVLAATAVFVGGFIVIPHLPMGTGPRALRRLKFRWNCPSAAPWVGYQGAEILDIQSINVLFGGSLGALHLKAAEGLPFTRDGVVAFGKAHGLTYSAEGRLTGESDVVLPTAEDAPLVYVGGRYFEDGEWKRDRAESKKSDLVQAATFPNSSAEWIVGDCVAVKFTLPRAGGKKGPYDWDYCIWILIAEGGKTMAVYFHLD